MVADLAERVDARWRIERSDIPRPCHVCEEEIPPGELHRAQEQGGPPAITVRWHERCYQGAKHRAGCAVCFQFRATGREYARLAWRPCEIEAEARERRQREDAEVREAARLAQVYAREAAKERAAAVKAKEAHRGFPCHAPGYPTAHCWCLCHLLPEEPS